MHIFSLKRHHTHTCTSGKMSLPSGLSLLHEYDSDSSFDEADYEKSKDNSALSDYKTKKQLSSCVDEVSDVCDVCREPSSKRPRILNDDDNHNNCDTGWCEHNQPLCASKMGSPIKNDKKTRSKISLSLPRVPANILHMFVETKKENPEDNPSQHKGRIRSFPHVRGNWASYMYIQCPEDAAVIMELKKILCDSAKSTPHEQSIHLVDEKHISLSRTLPFRHHWIEPFTDNVKKVVGSCQSFDVCFDKFNVYTNDEKSRTFISMKAINTTHLLDVVEKCDTALADFQLEPYYKDPSFHVSCAWMLGDQTKWVKQNLIPILSEKWSKSIENDPDLQFFSVSSVEFKTGNKFYKFFLQ